jgi:MFS family permease
MEPPFDVRGAADPASAGKLSVAAEMKSIPETEAIAATSNEADEAAAAADSSSQLSPGARLRRNRNFNLFWAGQTFDALGDSAALIIIPVIVLEITGSVAQMGLVTGVIGLGNLVSSLVSGVIVDRMDRRKVMILCDVGRAAFYLLIPIVVWMTGSSIWPICIIAMIAAYLTTFFFITYTTAVVNIVDKDQITEANGRLQSTVALAYVAGPVLVGYASHQLGAINSVVTLAASYAISALLMFFVRLRQASTTQPKEAAAKSSSRFDSALSGVRFILRHPVLRSVSLLFAVFIFVAAPTINLTIYRLKYELGQGDGTVGIVFGVASVGAIAGGALAAMLRNRLGFGFSFLGSTALIGAAIIFIGLAPGVATLAVFAAVLGFGTTIRNVNSMSLRQQVTPDHLLGRVSAAWWTMLTVLGPVGNALGAALAEWTSVKLVFTIAGVISIATAATGLLTRANARSPENTIFSAPLEAVE